MIGVVVHGLVFVLLGGATADTTDVDGDYGASFAAGLGAVGTLVLSIVSFVFGIFVQAAFLSGGLDLADGRPVTVGSFFKPRNFGTVVLAGALLSVISAVLDLLSLPGFLFALLSFVAIAVFTFFALFTIAFATDRGLAPIDALKASVSTVRAHIGETLLSFAGAGSAGGGGLIRLPRRHSRDRPDCATGPGVHLPPALRRTDRAADPLGRAQRLGDEVDQLLHPADQRRVEVGPVPHPAADAPPRRGDVGLVGVRPAQGVADPVLPVRPARDRPATPTDPAGPV